MRKRAKTSRRYRWAESFRPGDAELRRLSPAAKMGLDYAQELAENARERSRGALSGNMPERLSVQEIAREDGRSPVEVYRLIKQARIELFGKDLSDSAIYYRLRRERERGNPARRPCREEGCPRALPAGATARRRYCEFHAAPHSRIRRYRRRRAD